MSVYPLSKQGAIIRKQIYPLVSDESIQRSIKAYRSNQSSKLIPVFKPGDLLYELGAIGHPFHTSGSTYSPSPYK